MTNRKKFALIGILALIVIAIVVIIAAIKPWNRLGQNLSVGFPKPTDASEMRRYYENLGTVHYSFIPPEGWERSDHSNAYPDWEDSDISCVLFFQSIGAGISAKDAAKKFTDFIIQNHSNYTYDILSENTLTTNQGTKGYQVKMKWTEKNTSDTNSPTFVGTDYYFYQSGNIVMGHYSCQAGNDDEIKKILDRSAITFRFEK